MTKVQDLSLNEISVVHGGECPIGVTVGVAFIGGFVLAALVNAIVDYRAS